MGGPKCQIHYLYLKKKMTFAFEMGKAVRPSSLIRTSRWTLLIIGIWWGNKRYNTLKKQEDDIRAYNKTMKPIWDQEKAALKAKESREQMLYLAKEVGVTPPPGF